MKKILIFAMCLCAAAVMVSCGGDSSSGGSNSSSSGGNSSLNGSNSSLNDGNSSSGGGSNSSEMVDSKSDTSADSSDFGFVLPSKAVSPDLSKQDPSDDTIKFVFDDKGRVASYKYKTNKNELMTTYSYKDDKGIVDIYTFNGDIIAGEAHIDLPEFDDSVGFCENQGYFFNKYKF